MPHMTYGQVFILVKGDPGKENVLCWQADSDDGPKAKVTAVRDYLIIMVGQCSGRSPKNGFWVSKAVCNSR